ncbi:hypothetical protein [Aurantiacibacter luteus]|uniref:Glycosyl transferase family 28 C-terminal domain-containing protein n=1 Tax=Aurantiacibacter luteus TaxID=1581420 RepID=A0A0G9MZ04_9SPHN|nr:hypothetical protein [Aurantiacibacter luteus]KLE35935.1 hypothetical protein AAW00_06170 [Aurantiacibacter luteus]
MSQRDLIPAPIGIFVHHQGRGHAERAADLANALAPMRETVLFSARDDIFPPLADAVSVRRIPSLFEGSGSGNAFLESRPTPDIFHCAPLGWATITDAVATLTRWFAEARPALFVTDVSAELGQLARIASIPHVAVLQHGDRGDPGHMAAYDAAVGLLAPFDERLEQPDRPAGLRTKTCYCGGIGVGVEHTDRDAARAALRLPRGRRITLVLAGGGGQGTPTAPLTLGARADAEGHWVVIGKTYSEWHETPPGNLELRGWVEDAPRYLAAADRVVSSCGNTTVHQVLATGKPWVAIPEWRYFAEQEAKAAALGAAGVCATAPTWPSDAARWQALWDRADRVGSELGPTFVDAAAATRAAEWIDALANRCQSAPPMRLEAAA